MFVSCGHSFGGLMLRRVMDTVSGWIFMLPISSHRKKRRRRIVNVIIPFSFYIQLMLYHLVNH